MKKGIRKEIQEKKEDRETVTSEEEIKKVASCEMQVNLVSWFVG